MHSSMPSPVTGSASRRSSEQNVSDRRPSGPSKYDKSNATIRKSNKSKGKNESPEEDDLEVIEPIENEPGENDDDEGLRYVAELMYEIILPIRDGRLFDQQLPKENPPKNPMLGKLMRSTGHKTLYKALASLLSVSCKIVGRRNLEDHPEIDFLDVQNSGDQVSGVPCGEIPMPERPWAGFRVRV